MGAAPGARVSSESANAADCKSALFGGNGLDTHLAHYFFFLLEINKLARSVTGTASTDMSVAAPVVMLCLFLLSELFSLMAYILSVNQIFDKILK